MLTRRLVTFQSASLLSKNLDFKLGAKRTRNSLFWQSPIGSPFHFGVLIAKPLYFTGLA